MRDVKKRVIGDLVDIYQYPALDTAHVADPKAQLTIGDLHANPIKLLHVLVRQGVINLSVDSYASLVSIYREADPLTRSAYEEYKRILGLIEFKAGSVDLVRLIGDELADRGQHDLLVLALLDAMQAKGVPYTILLSNHGLEFVEAYEGVQEFGEGRLNAIPSNLLAPSIKRLGETIQQPDQPETETQFITRDAVMQLVNRVYKPKLKLLDFSFETDGLGITIFSHAAIDLRVIQSLAEKFFIEYQDGTPFQLADTIQRINEAFEFPRDNNAIHKCYDANQIDLMYREGRGFSKLANAVSDRIKQHPIEFLLWNRCQDASQLSRPAMHKGYRLSFAHGHNYEKSHDNIFGLDSGLGRGLEDRTDSYNVLYSQESSTFSEQVLNYTDAYFKLKSMRGDALRSEFSNLLAQVEGLYKTANTPAEIQLLADSLSYVYDSLQPNVGRVVLHSRLEALVKRFPETHHSKLWQKLLISLIALSALAALFGALVLGMALAAPVSALVIAPVIGLLTQGGAIASLVAGEAIAMASAFAVHKLMQPIEAPIVKSLRFFDKPLKPVFPVSKLAAASSAGEIFAPVVPLR